jgi:hypothetical protein
MIGFGFAVFGTAVSTVILLVTAAINLALQKKTNDFKGTSISSAAFFTVALIAIVGSYFVQDVFKNVRLRAAAHRAEPIIDALHRYHENHGKYPKSLNELTPYFLEKIPWTGLGGFQSFQYSATKSGERNDGFQISVRLTGFKSDNLFLYWSEGGVPWWIAEQRGYKEKRIGRWRLLLYIYY